MNLGGDDLRWTYYIIEEFMRRRRWSGTPIPDPARRLAERLKREIDTGTDEDPTDKALTGDEIDTRQAAAILQCTEQWARRIARDLDGIRVGRTWVFSRRVVQEYVDARRAA